MSVPDFPPNFEMKPVNYPTEGGVAIDLYMEGLMTSTIVIDESPAVFFPRFLTAQDEAYESHRPKFMEVEMIADPNTDCPRRQAWVDPLMIRSVTHVPTDHLHKLETEMGADL